MPLPCLLPKSDRTFRLIHPLFDGDHFKAGNVLFQPCGAFGLFMRLPYSAAAPLILFLFLSPPLL